MVRCADYFECSLAMEFCVCNGYEHYCGQPTVEEED